MRSERVLQRLTRWWRSTYNDAETRTTRGAPHTFEVWVAPAEPRQSRLPRLLRLDEVPVERHRFFSFSGRTLPMTYGTSESNVTLPPFR
jgi:hypothetical protein